MSRRSAASGACLARMVTRLDLKVESHSKLQLQNCMRGARSGRSHGRGRGRGRHNLVKPGQRPVSEAARIDITEQLESFQQSDETGG